VDIRYVPWFTEKVGKADFLLKEMGITNQSTSMRTFSRDLNEHIQSEKRPAEADGKNTASAPKQSRARQQADI
jgi:hypothetical protein